MKKRFTVNFFKFRRHLIKAVGKFGVLKGERENAFRLQKRRAHRAGKRGFSHQRGACPPPRYLDGGAGGGAVRVYGRQRQMRRAGDMQASALGVSPLYAEYAWLDSRGRGGICVSQGVFCLTRKRRRSSRRGERAYQKQLRQP